MTRCLSLLLSRVSPVALLWRALAAERERSARLELELDAMRAKRLQALERFRVEREGRLRAERDWADLVRGWPVKEGEK